MKQNDFVKIIGIVIVAVLVMPVFSAYGISKQRNEQSTTNKTDTIDNSPPGTPNITGPTTGKPFISYDYKFVAVDPDGDDLYYWIEWGEGCPSENWIGPYASGEIVTVSHTFSAKSTYTISAKAKDTPYGAESDWGTLQVTMPRNRVVNNVLFLQFLERLLHRFQQLEQIFVNI